MRLWAVLMIGWSLGVCRAAETPAPAAYTGARAEGPAPDASGRAEALFIEGLGEAPVRRIAPLTEALRLCPEEPRYWVALGDAYATPAPPAGEVPAQDAPLAGLLSADQARKTYLQAIRFTPKAPLPYLRLADLHWESDRPAAAAYLAKAIALDPEDAFPVYERAALHFLAGEDAAGQRCLEGARALKVFRLPLLLPTEALSARRAGVCIEQVRLPFLSHFRELARQIARVAEAHKDAEPGSPDDPRPLLLDGQRLAYRLANAEPRMLIGALVGMSIDATLAKPLEPLLVARGDADGLAALDARRKSIEAMRARVAEMVKRLEAGASDPDKKIRVLRDEGEMVARLVAESGLKETIDAP